MLGRFIDKALKKHWTPEEIDNIVGRHQSCHLSHAADPELRRQAASGGTTTALLISALESGAIDAAVVCTTRLEEGRVRARFVLARSREEIVAAQGSKYVATQFLKEVLPLIRGFDGRVAVIGLPCDLSALARRTARDPSLAAKVALTVGLVCGHNSRPELVDRLVQDLEGEAGANLEGYRFRIGHWRGQLEATFGNGTRMRAPASRFTMYQNLFFFAERKCLACWDHFAYDADIAVGDVWSYRMRSDPIKHTGVLVRTTRGAEVWRASVTRGRIVDTPMSVDEILDGQTRIAPYHYNVSARRRAGELLGVRVPDDLDLPVAWHQLLAALITVANARWSWSERFAPWIFRIPKPVLKAYLVALKGLESLR